MSLSELVRVVQFYNLGGLHCAGDPLDTEDGYLPGTGAEISCAPHAADTTPQNWRINLGELMRVIQLYNSGSYAVCVGTEDGYCPGA